MALRGLRAAQCPQAGSLMEMRRLPPAHRVRGCIAAGLALAASCLLTSACQRSTIPAAISDREFWALVETLSEPPGAFALSDNLVSNEPYFADIARVLRPGGGVYIGVGPEQNYSYIARLRPSIAFIIDIRRENRNLHLLYKALFDLSADRSEFVSRLFSRPRPMGLDASAGVDDIFERFERVPASQDLYDRTMAFVTEQLAATRGFPLSEADLVEIGGALAAFRDDGPEIHFWGSRPADAVGPSYRLLMTARDVRGVSRSYLSTDTAFRFVKDLHARNLVVPVVGDFAGATTFRRVGDYVRARADAVRAFYASNVGVYLTNQQSRAFCGNLATLPAAPGAVFIESNRMRSFALRLRACQAGVE